MRTRIPSTAEKSSAASARWASTAAASAGLASGKATQKASPSVLKTVPWWRAIASRITASCRATALRMASGWRSQRTVEPSMSVKRKTTAPAGVAPLSGVMRIPGVKTVQENGGVSATSPLRSTPTPALPRVAGEGGSSPLPLAGEGWVGVAPRAPSSRRARLLAGQRRMRRGEARDRHPVRRAADVIQPHLGAELHRGGVAAMLAADAELNAGPRLAAALAADADQLAHAFLVDGDERVALDDSLPLIGAEKSAGIVARQAEGGLGQVVGAEAEELGRLGDLVGDQRRPRQLDHRADEIALVPDLAGDAVDQRLQHLELLLDGDQRDHDLGLDRLAAGALDLGGRLQDRPHLHLVDFGIGDAEPAAAMAEHRVGLVQRLCAVAHEADILAGGLGDLDEINLS